ncbi:MAG: ComEC/Rec2 family competence protein, partial [Lachnospiraceae bacterium]|nr:ComEC/Rec2 family competence protein [Lachnospiraceae bacterium]
MKRPLLFLFFLTALGISCLYPRQYQADPIFPQGSYYTVTVHGQLQTYHHQTTTLSLTLTDCRIDYGEKTYQCPQLLVTVDEETKLYTSNQAVRDTAAFLPEDPPYHVRSSLRAGNLLAVEGSLSSFQPARNPGNFDWYSYYRARHLSYRLYADAITVTDPQCTLLRQTLLDLRSDLTNCLQRLCSDDPSTAALLTALLLGDKTALEEDTKAAYEDGGILHILTVSGLHISLLGTAALTLGKKCHLPPWLRNLLSGLLVLLYWQLCGAGMSAGRATIMFLCLTAAPLLGRTYDSLSALSLAGLLILWDSPTMLFQAGFQLSFGAVLGIQLVCPAFASTVVAIPDASAPPSLGKKLCDSLRFGLGLQLTLLPITLYHFFRYPLYSIF